MIDRQVACEWDARDELADLRGLFAIQPDEVLYMDGNSLGRMPLDATSIVSAALDDWRREKIIAWRGWIKAPRRIGDLIAASVVEADPGEVLVADSTTVNLYKLASAALDARPGRRRIVTSDDNFPTDLYVLQSLAEQRALQVDVLPADPVDSIDAARLATALDDDVALVCLSHVTYESGALLDMTPMTAAAHQVGALTLWDVSHSAGAVPVPLRSSGADLAVGCTYKYLNGGPGAPAFVYVRTTHQASLRQPIWGWFGHRDQFAMSASYVPADGIDAMLAGAPAILSTLAVEAGVRAIGKAGVAKLRAKGVRLTGLLIELADEWLAPYGVTIRTPRNPAQRGSHVTFTCPDARAVTRELIAAGVIPDFRPPNMIRFGAAPIYTRFVDAWDAVRQMREILSRRPT